MLAALLVGDDVSAFKYMKALNVEDHDDVKSGFKISLVCTIPPIHLYHFYLYFPSRDLNPTRTSRTMYSQKSSAMTKRVTSLLSQQKLNGKKERYKYSLSTSFYVQPLVCCSHCRVVVDGYMECM